MADAEDGWRIDDLAHRARVSVDTIRFYQREGLLPPARRRGRLTVFGPDHLLRLEQIRDLQSRQFNLAAIRTLLDENRLGLIGTLFPSGEGSYTRDELAKESGLPPELVDRLHEVGLLADPGREARPAYDNSDLGVLSAVRSMLELGMPEPVVLFLARLYVNQFSAMEDDVLAVFSGRGGVAWPESERRAFTEQVPELIATLLPLVQHLLDYVHQRTVQRMTLSAMELQAGPDDE